MGVDVLTRRVCLQRMAGVSAGLALPKGSTWSDELPRSALERVHVAAIGLRYQGSVITEKARQYGDIVALCDVDRHVREQARASFGSTPRIFEDYRDLLVRDDIDVVLIGTPDHWHAKMIVDACRAGKDVYCEKPLTLTLDEGKQVRSVVQQTGRVVQVGSWQRSDHRFRLAVEMVRQGRIGKLTQVDVVLGKNEQGGPFAVHPVPSHLNWDLWQGQTPDVPYIPERSHYTFRWWHEYSGGQMTDWGAHHLDIANWAIDSLPVHVSGTATYPRVANGYNVPQDFQAEFAFENGVRMAVADEGRNGILFTGTAGRLFVNRGSISGTPVDDLQQTPLPRESFRAYAHDNHDRPPRAGKLEAIVNHMGNFFDCLASRQAPVSDVESQHRSVSLCHLANISMQLNRPLVWDPHEEQFPEDHQANSLLKRDARSEFAIT